MCHRLQPVSAQPDAVWLDVRLSEDHENNRESTAGSGLLENEAIDRPNLVMALFVATRLRLGVVGIMMGVRRRMRMDEGIAVRVTLVAHRVDYVVRVGVRCD
jgi:hypothetical protein